MSYTLTDDEFEAFKALATKYVTDQAELRNITSFIEHVEKNNGRVSYFAVILWTEAGTALPAGAVYPTNWPESLKTTIKLARPITKSDVDNTLRSVAIKPVGIQITTTDPAGVLGLVTYPVKYGVEYA